MAAYEAAHLTEQLDTESPAPVAPHRRGRWLVAGVGLALAVAGCMGVAVGMARARKPASPMQRVSTIRNQLVKAFSSRALQEEADLDATATFVWNEEGAEDPSAMGVEAVFKQATEAHDEFAFKIIFLAQEGQGAELVNKLEDIVKSVVEFVRDGPGDEAADEIEKAVTISAGEGDEAVIEITPPSGDEEGMSGDEEGMSGDEEGMTNLEDEIMAAEDEIQKDVNEQTQFEASIFVGRSVQEMYEHKHTHILLLPNGIKVSAHVKVASALASVLSDDFCPSDSDCQNDTKTAIEVIKNLAQYNMRQEIFYRTKDNKLNGAFFENPDFYIGGAIQEMASLLALMPATVIGNLTGIETVADGVKSFEVLGLPDNWEVEAIFTNFHVAPLIGDCLKELSSSEPESE